MHWPFSPIHASRTRWRVTHSSFALLLTRVQSSPSNAYLFTWGSLKLGHPGTCIVIFWHNTITDICVLDLNLCQRCVFWETFPCAYAEKNVERRPKADSPYRQAFLINRSEGTFFSCDSSSCLYKSCFIPDMTYYCWNSDSTVLHPPSTDELMKLNRRWLLPRSVEFVMDGSEQSVICLNYWRCSVARIRYLYRFM